MANRLPYYQQAIREELAKMGRVGAADPRHVEGYMRLGHHTLDGLSPQAVSSSHTVHTWSVNPASIAGVTRSV